MFMKSAIFSISATLLLGTAFPAYAMDENNEKKENAKKLEILKIEYEITKKNCVPVVVERNDGVKHGEYISSAWLQNEDTVEKIYYKPIVHVNVEIKSSWPSLPYAYTPQECPNCKKSTDILNQMLELTKNN